jgi:hypothetical protein
MVTTRCSEAGSTENAQDKARVPTPPVVVPLGDSPHGTNLGRWRCKGRGGGQDGKRSMDEGAGHFGKLSRAGRAPRQEAGPGRQVEPEQGSRRRGAGPGSAGSPPGPPAPSDRLWWYRQCETMDLASARMDTHDSGLRARFAGSPEAEWLVWAVSSFASLSGREEPPAGNY